MKKQKSMLFWGVVLVVFLLFTGCSSYDKDNRMGLQVYDMTSSLGAVDSDDLDRQRLVYSITLTNKNNKDVYVKWIEPVVVTELTDKIVTRDLKTVVEKLVAANQSIEITGKFVLDTKGLSKKEIASFEPFITGFKVVCEQVINLK